MAVFLFLGLKAEDLTNMDFFFFSITALFQLKTMLFWYIHFLSTVFSQTGILNYNGKVNASRKLTVNVLHAGISFVIKDFPIV